MPFLRKNFYYQNGPEKIAREIQPHRKEKKIPQSPMGEVGFGQKSKGLRPLY